MKKGKILIIDDNEDVLLALNLLLKSHVEQVRVSTEPGRIEHFINIFYPDVILLDMNFDRDAVSGQEGLFWLDKIRKIDPNIVVVFITAYADMDKAIQAIKAGATDFIPKPWEKEKLLATVFSAIELHESRIEVKHLRQQISALATPAGDGKYEIIGESEAMLEIFDTVEKLRDTEANILILGENGTGKDLIAREIHRKSPRNEQIFVSLDLGSVAESLFESELFGYKKGAFTDAHHDKSGRLEVAAGGTLFLDEIGNLSLPMQMKLLTAIEKREIIPLGATRPVPIDVRFISATNENIHDMLADKRFRQDLLYRINTIEIHIPPLRARGNDVLLLADHFFARFNRKYNKKLRGISKDAKAKLLNYPWPGNVRELQHTMERAVILTEKSVLGVENFIFTPAMSSKQRSHEELNLNKLEQEAIEHAFLQADGNISLAAELLGITRYALYRKMEKLGI
ncbi:MAG: sigma-54 dependent transcriptional regulator [Prevotellaceae bacterium]|jgi:DNA-binding NtrC family response regulator|nr:sigma-54 dependent transcriptional regulator [Prevotellaceae bacterium]